MKLKDTIRFIKKYFSKQKKLFIKSFILLFFSSIIGVSFGYLLGLATENVVSSNFSIAIIIFIFYLILNIINNLYFLKKGNLCMKKACSNTMEEIGSEVYRKVSMLPAKAFEEMSSGELINRIVNDSSTITDTFRQLVNAFGTFFGVLLIFIYILFNSYVIALEIIIYFIIFYIVSKKYLPLIEKMQKSIQEDKDKTVAEVNESIRGIREIRALGIREGITEKVKAIIHSTFKKSYKQMVDSENYYKNTNALGSAFEITIFITCIILIALNKSDISFFIAMTYYVYRFTFLIDYAMDILTSYQKVKVSINRVNEILNNKLYSDIKFGTLHNTNIVGNIEFKNVTFKYSDNEKYILKDFNLYLPSNKKIAIVGKSGQGKTTLFNLLLRYFDVNSGVILIDDQPIEDFDEESFNQNIAVIRQEPFLFNKTILENFLVLDNYMSLNKVRKACKLAEIDDYIMSLPNKYDTLIGEGGINLSGGQKQRIAIARALLKNSKIILFDEATSALDNENQSKIKKAIDNLVENHTIIIIAHRLSTIIDADIIYLIDQGRVVAQGTHKELIKNNKLYQELYNNEN